MGHGRRLRGTGVEGLADVDIGTSLRLYRRNPVLGVQSFVGGEGAKPAAKPPPRSRPGRAAWDRRPSFLSELARSAKCFPAPKCAKDRRPPRSPNAHCRRSKAQKSSISFAAKKRWTRSVNTCSHCIGMVPVVPGPNSWEAFSVQRLASPDVGGWTVYRGHPIECRAEGPLQMELRQFFFGSWIPSCM